MAVQRRVAEPAEHLPGAAQSQDDRGDTDADATFGEQRHEVDDRGVGGARRQGQCGRQRDERPTRENVRGPLPGRGGLREAAARVCAGRSRGRGW